MPFSTESSPTNSDSTTNQIAGDSETRPFGPTAPNASRGSLNYASRHWRGELPLAVSFWVNVALLNVLSMGFEHGVQTALLGGPSRDPRESYPRMLLAFALRATVGLVVTTWQTIGTWRSARRSVSDWAALTKVCVAVFGLLFLTRFVAFEAPILFDQLAYMRESELHLTWKVRVLRAGTEMEVSGGIGAGFADDMARVLTTEPRTHVLHVNLERGGLVAEAARAQLALRRRHLISYVSGSCTSACTLVFLGGTERLLKKGAKLGFHAVKAPGSDAKTLEALREQTLKLIVDAGVNAEFAQHAMRIPSTSMWYPSEEELVAAGVVTKVTHGFDLALTAGRPPPSIEDARAMMDSVRLYRVIKSADPQRYDEIVHAVQQGLVRGRSLNEMRSVVAPILARVLAEAMPRASDVSLLGFADLLRKQAADLQQAPAELCAEFINTGNASRAYAYLSADSLRQELDVVADVIESSRRTAQSRPKMPAERETKQLLAQATRFGRKQVGTDITALAAVNGQYVDPSKLCHAALGLYSGIAELPPVRRAKLVRALFAQR